MVSLEQYKYYIGQLTDTYRISIKYKSDSNLDQRIQCSDRSTSVVNIIGSFDVDIKEDLCN